MTFALVILITLISLALPFVGAWLLWKKRNHWWGIVLGLACLGLFVISLPWLYTVGVLLLIAVTGNGFGG